ncbi:hypothetical protein MASR1M59_03130 [Melaminivora sp.]
MLHRSLRPLLTAVLLAGTALSAQAAICRAAPTASGAANGTTWQDAMTLPAALATSGCNEIWLKQGIYQPGTQRSDSFTITRPLKLYGGFTGGETALAQRGTHSRLTVLSGDIDGNDTVDAHGITARYGDIQGSNSYHVVRFGTTTAFTPTNTVIDGLTITGGQATSSNPNHMGAGLLCQALGAGRECSPRLANVTVSGNLANNSGGGMYASAKNSGKSSPEITHSTFSGNQALYGGGLAVDIIPYNDATTGSPAIVHSTFSGNAALQLGGAVYLGKTVAASVAHVTFADNQASAYGGALHAQHGAQASVAASVFWGNTAGTGGSQIGLANTTDGNGSTGTGADVGSLTGNIVQGGCANVYSYLSAVACTGSPSTGDPLLGALTDNGGPTHTMLPAASSPALNAATCSAGQTDQRGVARPTGANTCDIGALERQTSPPATPSNLTASTDLAQHIALAWQATNDAVSYRVQDVTGGGTALVCETSATACMVAVAGHGLARSYTVSATNEAGASGASAPQQGATLALPGQPASFSAASGEVRASTLTWDAPSTGGAIAGYIVTSGGAEVCNTTALSCSVTGLSNGSAYTFTLLARNAAGDSGTADANATTLALPATPASFSATPGVGQIALSWASVAGASGYVVQNTTSGSPAPVCNEAAASTGCSVTGLAQGMAYTFTLVARNAAGDSASPASTGATTLALPATPASFSATPGLDSVTLTWAAASGAGRYIVSNTTGGSPAQVCDTAALSCTVTGLAQGMAYTFALKARNAVGDSAAVNAHATTLILPGLAPAFHVQPGIRSLTLSWAAASNASSYSVSNLSSGGMQVCNTSGLGCSVTGLADGQPYSLRLVARNAAGDGPAALATGSTLGLPGAPASISADPGDASIVLRWTAPASDGGSAITGYSVTGTPAGACAPGLALSCTITGLGNGVEHRFTVVALNAVGTGPGISITATPAIPQPEPEPEPTELRVTRPGLVTITRPALPIVITAGAAGAVLELPGSTSPPASQPVSLSVQINGQHLTVRALPGTQWAVVPVPDASPDASPAAVLVLQLQQGWAELGASRAGQPLALAGQVLLRAASADTRIEARPLASAVLAGALLPAPAAWPQLDARGLLAGERLRIDAQGRLLALELGSLGQPGPSGQSPGDALALPALGRQIRFQHAPLRLPGPVPRLQGQDWPQLLQQQAQALGQALAPQAQAQVGGDGLGLLQWRWGPWAAAMAPLAPVRVDVRQPDGMLLSPQGLVQISRHGLVLTLAPTLVDWPGFAQALAALSPEADVQVTPEGVLLLRLAGQRWALRPALLAQQAAPAPGGSATPPRLALLADGRLALLGAQEQALPWALSDYASAGARLQQLLPGAQLQASLQPEGALMLQLPSPDSAPGPAWLLLPQPQLLQPLLDPALATLLPPGRDAALEGDGHLLLRLPAGVQRLWLQPMP